MQKKMMCNSSKLQQLVTFLLFLTSVFLYSLPFYTILYVLTLLVLIFSFVVTNIFSNLVCTLVLVLCLVHGWKGLSHVLEDYTFNALLSPVFVSLANLILFRFVFNLWF